MRDESLKCSNCDYYTEPCHRCNERPEPHSVFPEHWCGRHSHWKMGIPSRVCGNCGLFGGHLGNKEPCGYPGNWGDLTCKDWRPANEPSRK